MLRFKKFILIIAISYILLNITQAQDTSPCPRLFVYESKSIDRDKWYGLLTLLDDFDVKGIRIHLVFDKPSIQLGNWFGQVTTTDNIEYLIENSKFKLKGHTPHIIRFYIKYDPLQPPPRLISFWKNGILVCPDVLYVSELQTSRNREEPTSSAPPTEQIGAVNSGTNTSPSTSGNDLYTAEYNRSSSQSSNVDLLELDSVCGTVIPQPRPLITYGQPSGEGRFPWHVGLYFTRGYDIRYGCGASLISKLHVITVAHCVTLRGTMTLVNIESLVVYLGKFYFKTFSTPGIQDRRVSAITIHPDFKIATYSNNVAIIKLSKPAEITDYVRPVCLWQDSIDLGTILHKVGTVVGWGFDETAKTTEQLMVAKMPVVSQEACIFSDPDFYSQFSSTNTFCAGFRNGSSVCNGDSGGGIVFPKSNSNPKIPVWQLRGLVSLSKAVPNQFKCDKTHYTLFTDTAKYLDWIKQIMLK